MNPLVKITNAALAVRKESHPLLGRKFKDFIPSFAKKFPLGAYNQPAQYPVKDFDLWLQANGFVVLPPMNPPCPITGEDSWTPQQGAKSDGWVAHTQRRYQLMKELVKASAHTRVRDDHNLVPFHVSISHGIMTVRPTQEKLTLGELPKEIQSVISTKKIKVQRLMESADFSLLSPSEQVRVEHLADAISGFEDLVQTGTRTLKRQFDRLRASIDVAVKRGTLLPVNGGVLGILAEGEILDIEDDAEDSLTA